MIPYLTGKKWEDKVAEVRAEMIKAGADMLVVTALDEVAWLLNLRGNDIPYNPGQSSSFYCRHTDLQWTLNFINLKTMVLCVLLWIVEVTLRQKFSEGFCTVHSSMSNYL